jgi:hypothetical protein
MVMAWSRLGLQGGQDGKGGVRDKTKLDSSPSWHMACRGIKLSYPVLDSLSDILRMFLVNKLPK